MKAEEIARSELLRFHKNPLSYIQKLQSLRLEHTYRCVDYVVKSKLFSLKEHQVLELFLHLLRNERQYRQQANIRHKLERKKWFEDLLRRQKENNVYEGGFLQFLIKNIEWPKLTDCQTSCKRQTANIFNIFKRKSRQQSINMLQPPSEGALDRSAEQIRSKEGQNLEKK